MRIRSLSLSVLLLAAALGCDLRPGATPPSGAGAQASTASASGAAPAGAPVSGCKITLAVSGMT